MIKKHKKTIIIVAIVLLIIIITYVRVKREKETANTIQLPTGGTGGTTPPLVSSNTVNEDTVFHPTLPYPNSVFVKYIQTTYNNYTNERKLAGKTPDYPKISVDGVYGLATGNAVKRYMGVNYTSWKDFKTRIDYFRSILND